MVSLARSDGSLLFAVLHGVRRLDRTVVQILVVAVKKLNDAVLNLDCR